MDKTRTSTKRRISSSRQRKGQSVKSGTFDYYLKENAEVSEYEPFEFILNEQNLAAAITECLMTNYPNGIVDILEHYLNACNKSALLKKAHLSRSTMYQLLKKRNPTIRTLAKLIHATQH